MHRVVFLIIGVDECDEAGDQKETEAQQRQRESSSVRQSIPAEPAEPPSPPTVFFSLFLLLPCSFMTSRDVFSPRKELPTRRIGEEERSGSSTSLYVMAIKVYWENISISRNKASRMNNVLSYSTL